MKKLGLVLICTLLAINVSAQTSENKDSDEWFSVRIGKMVVNQKFTNNVSIDNYWVPSFEFGGGTKDMRMMAGASLGREWIAGYFQVEKDWSIFTTSLGFLASCAGDKFSDAGGQNCVAVTAVPYVSQYVNIKKLFYINYRAGLNTKYQDLSFGLQLRIRQR